MILALFIWSTGLYIMWYRNRRHLPLEDEPEVPRGLRALLELSQAMERQLTSEGIDLRKVTDREAKRETRKRLHGGAVSLNSRLAKPANRTWASFLSWLWREKWWIAFYFGVLALGVMATFVWGDFTSVIILCTLSGVIPVVLWLGTMIGSRVLMLVVVCFVLVVVVIPCTS